MSLIDSVLPVPDSSSVSTIGDEEDEFAEKSNDWLNGYYVKWHYFSHLQYCTNFWNKNVHFEDDEDAYEVLESWGGGLDGTDDSVFVDG